MKIYIAVFLFFILPLFAFGSADYDSYLKSGHRSEKWNEFIKAGFESFDANSLSTGVIFLEKAHAKGCRDGMLLYKLGAYHLQTKDTKKAMELLTAASKKLSEQYPSSDYSKEMPRLIGELLFQEGKYGQALPYIEKALNGSPDDFMLNLVLGQIKRRLGDLKGARDVFEKTLQIPVSADLEKSRYALLLELMTLTHELKDQQSALSYAEQILAVYPNDPTAQSYKNNIRQKMLQQKEKEMIKKYTE